MCKLQLVVLAILLGPVPDNMGINESQTYSPIVLNQQWSSLGRLFLIIGCALIGTTVNGFFVTSFFVESLLRRPGNVYLACIGVADMLITSAILPIVTVVLISRMWEQMIMCYVLQLIAQTSTYSYNLFFMMVGVETYVRLCRTSVCYRHFIGIPVGTVSILVFTISCTVSSIGVYYGMDYDYCNREHHGNFIFRLITTLVLQVAPFVATIIFLSTSSVIVRARAIRLARYRRSKDYKRDYAFTNLNLGCYCLYVIAWLPYLVIVNKYPDTADSNYYNWVWIGLMRSLITSFLYGGVNGNFRRAFRNLFFYCFLKSPLTEPDTSRRRAAAADFAISRRGAHVHILHQPTSQRWAREGSLLIPARHTREIGNISSQI